MESTYGLSQTTGTFRDPFFSSFKCAQHFELSKPSGGISKRCLLENLSSSSSSSSASSPLASSPLFTAPTAGLYGESWGFVCGSIWAGHLGFWWHEERPSGIPRGLDGSHSALDEHGYGVDRCPAPMTKEHKDGVSICTVYLNYDLPGRSAPVTRLYPVCEVVPGHGIDSNGRQALRIGYAINDVAAAAMTDSGGLLSRSFACPGDWRGHRGAACDPPPIIMPTRPARLLQSWTDLDAPMRSAVEHAAAVTRAPASNAVLFTTASFAYLPTALTWCAYHRRRGVPVVVVALDLPSFFALSAARLPVAYATPLSGRPLGPWCVERWLMPAWRLAHHAKAAAAAAAVAQGYHAGVMDLDVFLDDESPPADWTRIASETSIAHSGTFDFFFGFTAASEPARQMWENVHASVLHGAWDQTSWGWWGDRFRQALNGKKFRPPPGPPSSSSSSSSSSLPAGLSDGRDGLRLHHPPPPPLFVSEVKKEVVMTGRHEHMPAVAQLPGNVTLRRLQNKEGQLRARLQRAMDRLDRQEAAPSPLPPPPPPPPPPPSPSSLSYLSSPGIDNAPATSLEVARCQIRWYYAEGRGGGVGGGADGSPTMAVATPCGSSDAGSASSSTHHRMTASERWWRRRLCTSLLLGLASALDSAFPATSSEATETATRVAVLDGQTWAVLDTRLLSEWFEVTGDDSDERAREREKLAAHHEQRRQVPGTPWYALDLPEIIDALTFGEQRREYGRTHEKGVSSSSVGVQRQRIDLSSVMHSACDLRIAIGGSPTSSGEQLTWDDMAALWKRLRQHLLLDGSGASRAVLKHIDLFVAPRLPSRRIQGFNCLPPPFHHEASCLRQCEQRRKNATHECKAFLGDAPLPVEHCPGTASFRQIRCQHDSLTPRCKTALVQRPP